MKTCWNLTITYCGFFENWQILYNFFLKKTNMIHKIHSKNWNQHNRSYLQKHAPTKNTLTPPTKKLATILSTI
jgi:hypothetical protein